MGKVVRNYRIERLLGIGGMAAVYAGTDLGGHRVAIKMMHEHFYDDPKMVCLFRHEAEVANQVGHPGAVPVLAHDIDEEGGAFLVMPLLEGETLRHRWERANKRLPVSEVAVLMADVLDVLGAAHYAMGAISGRHHRPLACPAFQMGQFLVADHAYRQVGPLSQGRDGAVYDGHDTPWGRRNLWCWPHEGGDWRLAHGARCRLRNRRPRYPFGLPAIIVSTLACTRKWPPVRT